MIMNGNAEKLISIIKEKNPMHGKNIAVSFRDIQEDEIVNFERLINFYLENNVESVEMLAEEYLRLISLLVEEQFYFAEHKRYRFSTAAESESYYANEEYMSAYLVGLGLSTYLWTTHRNVKRLFQDFIRRIGQKDSYFEIGPGHGEYFVAAMKEGNFQSYKACDISKSSVDMTIQYIEHSFPGKMENKKNYCVEVQDIFDYPSTSTFDVVVMGEVLEHVEKPTEFISKIRDILADDGYAFLTTAINAPQPDHIYLFRDINEVTDMFEGFTIVDQVVTSSNNYSLEKAEEKGAPLVVGFILQKDTVTVS